MALVNQERNAGIAILTLNRPEAMNALSRALQTDLADAINAAASDPDVRVLVLTGSGEKAFSAGLDLKEVAQFGLSQGARESDRKDPVEALAHCPKPVIGAINGVAITGGFELALSCDVLVASVNARFADTHARVGVIPGWGLSQRLSRLIGVSRAKEMSFTGNFVDAEKALAWGLVNRVVGASELMPAALALAADMASCDPLMIVDYKALIDEGFGLPFQAAMDLEAQKSRERNSTVTAESVGQQRQNVLARGRRQSQDPGEA